MDIQNEIKKLEIKLAYADIQIASKTRSLSLIADHNSRINSAYEARVTKINEDIASLESLKETLSAQKTELENSVVE